MAIGDACLVSICSARMQEVCAATFAWEESRWEAQAMVGELLHPAAMCACSRFASCSSTSQWQSRPAISKSELVIVLAGFAVETRAAVISRGNGSYHTVGGSSHWLPNQTPPAPCFEALQ